MRINKKNPKHIFILIKSNVYMSVAVIIRPFIKRKSRNKIVIFYGHTLNGNLNAFFEHLIKQEVFEPYFLAIDKNYYEKLNMRDVAKKRILSATKLKDIGIIARSDVWITSHGIHFPAIRKLSNIKFADVWHGIPYKGFDETDFSGLHDHDQIWVSSEKIKELYVKKFGFQKNKVQATGYGRTDQLVNKSLQKTEILNKYSIPKARKYILIAPTWKQDDQNRAVLPFGVSSHAFFSEIDKIADDNNTHVIFRTHLNSSEDMNTGHLNNTSFMPYARYESAEDFLYIADLLITDWSSIAFDYLPLMRPTIFLDVPAPFKKGFSLGPEYRFGDIAKNFSDLKNMIAKNLNDPNSYLRNHQDKITKTTLVAYGDMLDGKALDRYLLQLKILLDINID